MVHFVGAGPGAADLITLRGAKLLAEADVIIYAGSLVNPELLDRKKADCRVHNSAYMTLEQVMEVIGQAETAGLTSVRLHTGDPSLYGAVREQMDALEKMGISYDVCPGVSSFCGAAASLGMEFTLPGVSQTLVITRMAGRTPMPERESIRALAAHRASMAVFLSAGMAETLAGELMAGGYPPETPAALVYKATWPEERRVVCTVETLGRRAREENMTKTTMILVGDAVAHASYDRSLLYHPEFTTEYRTASHGALEPCGAPENAPDPAPVGEESRT